MYCNRKFKNAGSLGRHKTAKHSILESSNPFVRVANKYIEDNRIVGRRSFSTKFKAKVCASVDWTHRNPKYGVTQTKVAYLYGISKGMVSTWYNARWEEEKVAIERCHFPVCERELYLRFAFRRKIKGLYCDQYWLKAEMMELVKQLHPGQAFTASNGWLAGFKKRWRISSQRITERKSKGHAGRVALLQDQHTRLFDLQKSDICDPFWGRFSPSQCWHMDQIPVAFVLGRNSTLNEVGHEAWVASIGGDGLRKRQATLMPTMRAFGKQIVPLVIIFRGKGVGLTQAEWDFYGSLEGIRVIFQPKAWCDTGVMTWYVLHILRPALIENGICSEEQLLFLDNLGAHRVDVVTQLLRELNIYPFFTAPGCTDVAAPIDHHVGGLLKTYMRQFYQADCEHSNNYNLWRNAAYNKSNKALCALNRRCLIAKWASFAWCNLKQKPDLFLKAFLHTGS